jgi:hypothetical protein
MNKSSHVYKTIEIVKNEIIENRAETGATYEELGTAYGVDKAVIWKIVNRNYEPKDAHNRTSLELSPLIPTPACPKCGVVHLTTRCPTARKPKRELTPGEKKEQAIKSLVRSCVNLSKLELNMDERLIIGIMSGQVIRLEKLNQKSDMPC